MTAPPATAEDPHAQHGFFDEFREFLLKYGVVTLAIAFVIGQALNDLVKIVVSGLLMPLVNPAFTLFGSDWRTVAWDVGPFGPFLVGQLLYAIVYFLVIALFVFGIARYVLRQKEVKKV